MTTGSLLATLAAPTLSASGQLLTNGSLLATLAPPTLSASGSTALRGWVVGTLPLPTLSAGGAPANLGRLVTALSMPALSATGTPLIIGNLDVVLDDAVVTHPVAITTGNGRTATVSVVNRGGGQQTVVIVWALGSQMVNKVLAVQLYDLNNNQVGAEILAGIYERAGQQGLYVQALVTSESFAGWCDIYQVAARGDVLMSVPIGALSTTVTITGGGGGGGGTVDDDQSADLPLAPPYIRGYWK